MRVLIVGIVGLFVTACASGGEPVGAGSSSVSSGCGDISGNYKLHSERVSGSCPASSSSTSDDALSVRKSADDQWVVVFPGIQGGCPAVFNESSCRLTASCKFLGKNYATVATLELDYTFTASGFSGSEVGAILPPIVAKPCDAQYQDEGSRL